MACGVALVATTGGALPEVVGTDGVTGLLVAPDDPGALARAIGRLLDDDELRQRLGAAGRQRVLGRFTWQVTASGTAAEYQALLADADRGPTGPDVVDSSSSSALTPEPQDHAPNLPTEAQPC
jgi:glycosyltransferase involved in cell wall biosynthesis